MLNQVVAPSREELLAELKTVREKGLPELDELDLPALVAAASVVIPADGQRDDAAAVETLLRRAVSRLSGGKFGDALVQLFGLDGHTRTLTGGVRRANAAEKLGISERTFRRKHEEPMLREVARMILVLCNERRLHDGRDRLSARHPVESDIAIQWIELFRAYYRIWSPISGLANDLNAYRSTLLEEARPYDRRFGTRGPDDRGYSQEEQAEGYARFALYHYAHFEWQLRRFQAEHGGLWLLSDADTELAVRDAVYRIGWHVQPFNERDESFLRTLIDEAPNQELHPFLTRLADVELGQNLHRQWQEWVATCDCAWLPDEVPDSELFATSSNVPGISSECQVHQVVGSCALYCRLVDEDWLKIADWYQLDAPAHKSVTAERLYTDWRVTPRGAAYEPPE
jgi:hypothetical protein